MGSPRSSSPRSAVANTSDHVVSEVPQEEGGSSSAQPGGLGMQTPPPSGPARRPFTGVQGLSPIPFRLGGIHASGLRKRKASPEEGEDGRLLGAKRPKNPVGRGESPEPYVLDKEFTQRQPDPDMDQIRQFYLDGDDLHFSDEENSDKADVSTDVSDGINDSDEAQVTMDVCDGNNNVDGAEVAVDASNNKNNGDEDQVPMDASSNKDHDEALVPTDASNNNNDNDEAQVPVDVSSNKDDNDEAQVPVDVSSNKNDNDEAQVTTDVSHSNSNIDKAQATMDASSSNNNSNEPKSTADGSSNSNDNNEAKVTADVSDNNNNVDEAQVTTGVSDGSNDGKSADQDTGISSKADLDQDGSPKGGVVHSGGDRQTGVGKDAAAPVVKRGRGRPPKNGARKIGKVPSGRPRGRPRRDVSSSPDPLG